MLALRHRLRGARVGKSARRPGKPLIVCCLQQVVDAAEIANALREAIADPEVKALGRLVGGVDQFVERTDVLGARFREVREALRE